MVYCTLSLPKEMDVIEALHFDEEHRYYEIKTETEHYHLLRVRHNQRVSRSPGGTVERSGQRERFHLSRVHVDSTGICAQCRAKE